MNPPKKGLPVDQIHAREPERVVTIEAAFDPNALGSTVLRIDAKNPVDLTAENLLDRDGLLRLRLKLTTDSKPVLEIKISDVDDPELFGIALQSKEKDLLDLLTARGLDAIRSGKETNAEKRRALRDSAVAAGATLRRTGLMLGKENDLYATCCRNGHSSRMTRAMGLERRLYRRVSNQSLRT